MKDASHKKIFTNKLVVIAFIPTLIISALSSRVFAEDQGVCFMVTPSGKTINLGKICARESQPQTIAQVPNNTKILPGKIARIPIKRRIGKIPVIEVKFNNNQTYEMILDTGATATLITRRMANKLNVKSTGIIEAQIADGTQVKLFTGKVKSIAVAGVTAKNIEVAIAPKAGIGLLGHDFFGDYDIKLLENEVQFYLR
ncbi:MAG TPA: retropepsin-like aspartic protease [Nostocaceae cyanobacterium]|nr:retropepsin-like aspartic protease [Nostocaceae cyanobacterium]